jgi:anion-transporting  ArsA/GET3 family ATPase
MHALHVRGGYDLVVLDTPPTSNALDFLDAPERIIDFLDSDAARLLGTPMASAGRVGLKVFQAGSNYAGKVLSRFTGQGTLEELARFLSSLSGMYDGFKERAAAVRSLLSSDQTAFVIVTRPEAMVVDEALHFHALLQKNQMPVAAVVANRVNRDFLRGAPPDADAIVAATERLSVSGVPGLGPLTQRLQETLSDEQVLNRLDREQVQRLSRAVGPTPVIAVERLDHDVHDLSGLWEVDAQLFKAP